MPAPPKQDSPMTAAKMAMQRSDLHDAALRGDLDRIMTLIQVSDLVSQAVRESYIH